MFKRKSIINKWHIIGIFWIIIVGSLLHFTYEWSDKSIIVGFFSAVNESVWEHLKLGYFALTFFMLIDYWILKNKTSNYFTAKASGIISMNLLIVIGHYTYQAIVSNTNVIFHIGLFIAGAVVCQLVSINIMKRDISKFFNYIGFIVYVLIGVLFVSLTPSQTQTFTLFIDF